MRLQLDELVGDFLVELELLDNPLEALSALDHVDDQHSLVVSVILFNMFHEFNVSTTDSYQERIIILVLLDSQSVAADQIKVSSNPVNWDSDT